MGAMSCVLRFQVSGIGRVLMVIGTGGELAFYSRLEDRVMPEPRNDLLRRSGSNGNADDIDSLAGTVSRRAVLVALIELTTYIYHVSHIRS